MEQIYKTRVSTLEIKEKIERTLLMMTETNYRVFFLSGLYFFNYTSMEIAEIANVSRSSVQRYVQKMHLLRKIIKEPNPRRRNIFYSPRGTNGAKAIAVTPRFKTELRKKYKQPWWIIPKTFKTSNSSSQYYLRANQYTYKYIYKIDNVSKHHSVPRRKEIFQRSGLSPFAEMLRNRNYSFAKPGDVYWRRGGVAASSKANRFFRQWSYRNSKKFESMKATPQYSVLSKSYTRWKKENPKAIFAEFIPSLELSYSSILEQNRTNFIANQSLRRQERSNSGIRLNSALGLVSRIPELDRSSSLETGLHTPENAKQKKPSVISFRDWKNYNPEKDFKDYINALHNGEIPPPRTTRNATESSEKNPLSGGENPLPEQESAPDPSSKPGTGVSFENWKNYNPEKDFKDYINALHNGEIPPPRTTRNATESSEKNPLSGGENPLPEQESAPDPSSKPGTGVSFENWKNYNPEKDFKDYINALHNGEIPPPRTTRNATESSEKNPLSGGENPLPEQESAPDPSSKPGTGVSFENWKNYNPEKDFKDYINALHNGEIPPPRTTRNATESSEKNPLQRLLLKAIQTTCQLKEKDWLKL